MRFKYLPGRIYKGQNLNMSCPYCDKKSLGIMESSIVVKERAVQWHLSQQDFYDPEYEESTFSMLLVCRDKSCDEIVQVIGKSGQVRDDDPRLGYERFYEPRYFYPTISFIPILQSYPGDLRELVEETCSLLPGHTHAAVQSIRIIVEYLLDHLGCKGKNLHRRIEAYQGEYKPYFEALKWVGNTASHHDKAISQRDLEKCCTLIDHTMRSIFEPAENHDEIIKNLMSTYGPRDKK